MRNYSAYTAKDYDLHMQPILMANHTKELLRRREITGTKTQKEKRHRPNSDSTILWDDILPEDVEDNGREELQTFYLPREYVARVADARSSAMATDRLLPPNEREMRNCYDSRWDIVLEELRALHNLHQEAISHTYGPFFEAYAGGCVHCTLSFHPVYRLAVWDLMHMARGSYRHSTRRDGDKVSLSYRLDEMNLNTAQVNSVFDEWANKRYYKLGEFYREMGMMLDDREMVTALVEHASSSSKILCTATLRTLAWETDMFVEMDNTIELDDGGTAICLSPLILHCISMVGQEDSSKALPLISSVGNSSCQRHKISPIWKAKLRPLLKRV